MDYKQRLQLARDFGPRRPLLRHVLLCLVLWDTQADRLVYGGRLEHETGYSERAIRKALGELVELGWLQPEVAPREGLDSVNQYGESRRPRVHGHTGGCKAGGIGFKTRYFITYRTSPCGEQLPPKGARRSPLEGGTAFPHPPADEAGRGNAVPQKGERRAAEGGTAFPRLDIERDREKDMAGGYPPLPPGEVVEAAPLPPAAADAADCPQGSLPGPVGPEATQGMEAQGGARQSRQLAAGWPEVVQRMAAANRDNMTGIRLWIATPKVQPIDLRGAILHLEVPSVLWAQHLTTYAPQLCAIVASCIGPCSTLVCHPKEAAA
jgi:hypothetical protein